MSREITNEEARELFLAHVRDIVDYWRNCSNTSIEAATNGVAFSILSLLDGESGMMPAYEVIPSPHPDDRKFRGSEGEDYYPEPSLENNIAGQLHERFFKK